MRPVGIFAGIGHAEHASLAVLQLKVLIWKLGSVDRLPARAWSQDISSYPFHRNFIRRRTITIGEITALYHELLDDTMKSGAFIAKAFLASAKSAEVLGGLRDSLSVKADHNSSQRLITVCNVQEDLSGWSIDVSHGTCYRTYLVCYFWPLSGLSRVCEKEEARSEHE